MRLLIIIFFLTSCTNNLSSADLKNVSELSINDTITINKFKNYLKVYLEATDYPDISE